MTQGVQAKGTLSTKYAAEAFVRQLDTDGSGGLEHKELLRRETKTRTLTVAFNDRLELTHITRARDTGMSEQDFRRLDIDGNGSLSAGELDAGWSAHREGLSFFKKRGANFDSWVKGMMSHRLEHDIERKTVARPFEPAKPGTPAHDTQMLAKSIASTALRTDEGYNVYGNDNQQAVVVMSAALSTIRKQVGKASDPQGTTTRLLIDAAYANARNLTFAGQRAYYRNTLQGIIGAAESESATTMDGLKRVADAALKTDRGFNPYGNDNQQAVVVMSAALSTIQRHVSEATDPKLKAVAVLIESAFANSRNLNFAGQRAYYRNTLATIHAMES